MMYRCSYPGHNTEKQVTLKNYFAGKKLQKLKTRGHRHCLVYIWTVASNLSLERIQFKTRLGVYLTKIPQGVSSASTRVNEGTTCDCPYILSTSMQVIITHETFLQAHPHHKNDLGKRELSFS